jgi:hypothetical protein
LGYPNTKLLEEFYWETGGDALIPASGKKNIPTLENSCASAGSSLYLFHLGKDGFMPLPRYCCSLPSSSYKPSMLVKEVVLDKV